MEELMIKKIQKFFTLILLLASPFLNKVIGQADVKNISKTFEEAKKQAAHDEFMSYVYMTIGFLFVIGVAWFTTSLAKKQKQKSDAEKAERALKMNQKGTHHQRRR